MIDTLEAEQDWFSLTMFRGQYTLEYQAGRIGPFFSMRGLMCAFQEAKALAAAILPVYEGRAWKTEGSA